MNKTIAAHISILSANIIYGVNYSVAKGIMPDYVKPIGLVLLRIIGTLVLFLAWDFFVKTEKLEKKDLIRAVGAALFGVALNQFLFLKGLSFTTPIDASIIMTVNPILVLIVSAILLKERITTPKILGITIGASGAILLILKGGHVDFGSENFLGNVMNFFNALSYGIYLVMIKPLMLKYKPQTVMKWVFLAGFVYISPFGFNDLMAIEWSNLPFSIIGAIIYVVVATTFLAYLLNIYGLKYVQPTTVSIYIYSQPVIASVVAILLGKDQLSIIKVASTFLVFLGVYLVSKRPSIK